MPSNLDLAGDSSESEKGKEDRLSDVEEEGSIKQQKSFEFG